jgi:hypothetical protein
MNSHGETYLWLAQNLVEVTSSSCLTGSSLFKTHPYVRTEDWILLESTPVAEVKEEEISDASAIFNAIDFVVTEFSPS